MRGARGGVRGGLGGGGIRIAYVPVTSHATGTRVVGRNRSAGGNVWRRRCEGSGSGSDMRVRREGSQTVLGGRVAVEAKVGAFTRGRPM